MLKVFDGATPRDPTASETKTLDRWRVSTFWVMLVGYIGYYLCRANLPAAFPLMSEEFQFTNEQLGLIAAYSEVAYSVGKFINGPLADKLGGRKIFLVGMAGAIFWNIVFTFASSLAGFITVWCACRYFLSMGWGGLAKVIGHWYPPEKNGTVMGLISINFQFGGVVATLFAGFLVAIGVGWKGVFLYPAAVLILILIWSALASRAKPADVVPGARFVIPNGRRQIANLNEDGELSLKEIVLSLFSLRVFWLILLFSFFSHILRSFFFFWTPKYLVDIGMGTTNAILKSAVFPFLGCVGTIFIGWYTDRYAKNGDRARMMWMMLLVLTGLLVGLSFLTMSATLNFGLIVATLGACGFFLLGPYSMSAGSLSLDIAGPRAAGTCTGMVDGVGYIGGAVVAWAAGWLSDHMGWAEVFMFLAAASLVSVGITLLMSHELQKSGRKV